MMTDREIAFTNYVEAFKKLDTLSKKKEIINSLRELMVVFDTLSAESNINISYMKEIREVNLAENNLDDDNFLNASIVYLEVAKDVIGQYLSSIM